MTRRLPLGIIVPAALVVLVGTLATLQYRWLGQVSEAERDELRVSLERRTTEFADDFDREISRAYTSFQSTEPGADRTPPSLAQAWTAWRAAARVPALVKAVYFVQNDDHETPAALFLYATDTDRAERAEWPASLQTVRTRLMPMTFDNVLPPPVAAVSRAQLITFTNTTIVSDVPAVVVPVAPLEKDNTFVSRTPPTPAGAVANVLVAMRVPHDYLVLVLDRDVITRDLLPALADRHFESDRYRVVVSDGGPTPLLTRGLAPGASIDPASADVTMPLLVIRPDLARDVRTTTVVADGARGGPERQPAVGAAAGPRGNVSTSEFSLRVEQSTTGTASRMMSSSALRPGWRVMVQHSAGSLDAAVAQARRRNLYLSFGILSVLVASVGLIVLNARRSERLAAQQMDFVATVSHELRTPVTVIRSAAQNLSAGVVQSADQAKQYGDLIETEGRRLTEMVEQVLDYAGLTSDRRLSHAQPIDVGHTAHAAVSACAGLLGTAAFDIDVRVADGLPPVIADEMAIRRALQNLISNAVKHAADGRWVGLTVTRASAGRHPEVQIAVSDRGQGIDAEDLPHLFEPFYRGRHALDRQIQGNGLGLSLVKRIADAHGGRVTVKSSPGQGATFTLHLPASPASSVVSAIETPAVSSSSGSPA